MEWILEMKIKMLRTCCVRGNATTDEGSREKAKVWDYHNGRSSRENQLENLRGKKREPPPKQRHSTAPTDKQPKDARVVNRCDISRIFIRKQREKETIGSEN